MLRRVLQLGLDINWLRILPVVACTAIAAALPVGLPLILGRTVDAALRGAGLIELLPLLVLVAAIAVAAAVAEVVANSLGARVGYGLSWQLARRLYGHLLRMPLLTYSTINPGVLNSRLTNDMRMVDPLFATVPLAVVHGWVGLAAVAIALALINIWFLVAFALVPIALLAVRFAEGQINSTIKDSYEVNAAAASQIESTTSGDAVSLVRQARATEAEERRFGEIADQSIEIAYRMDNWRAVISVAYRLCFDLITVLFLGIGVLLASAGQISIGSVVSALFFVGLVRQPLGEVVGQRYPLIRAGMGLDRVEAVLQSPNTGLATVAASARPADPLPSEDVLTFEGVSYAYPDRSAVAVNSLSDVACASSGMSGFLAGVSLTRLNEAEEPESDDRPSDLLNDISFSVRRGETVAIAGHSGSGKSTIISLACGTVRPSNGTVRVEGLDTRQLTEEDVWRSVSLVSQDVYLRDASLRDNLNYGLPDATDERLVDALHKAGLGDLLRQLPDGLGTMVGQRGKRFSGGERQRIAIARAVLRDRPLLILDEATSHLDTEREEGILDAMEAIATEKAVLVVAHRASAIERADRVIMIERGRVVERGTHAELLAAGGSYASMHRARAGA
ncbi:ABC transporter ATP-binding protein [Mesorhizobium muleiense]|uniref:ABC transporter ATP-binding protein n=1 Tax=Mesorhizobium muleiense TaxID=1004279 RepID=UPI001F425CBF|nr:ABC transporter ATP-binding protein [Mesorhizobium muleiense]MCF6113111.1 ABC transporter ATP-binding protein/permease [Mesorhizobium muleiense]